MFVGLNFVYIVAAFCVAFFQLHDNQLISLPDSIGDLEQLQKLILRYDGGNTMYGAIYCIYLFSV